jgi:hypothetical protein
VVVVVVVMMVVMMVWGWYEDGGDRWCYSFLFRAQESAERVFQTE